MKLSSNAFTSGIVNSHLKDWLTYLGGTNWPGKLCHLSITCFNHIKQSWIIDFSNLITDYDSHNPILDLFLSFDFDYSHADWYGLCNHIRDVS